MPNSVVLTASHIRYLLALKRLGGEYGIRSIDIANDLNLSKVSVHNMMDTFLTLKYISKEHGGQVYLTEYGLSRATEFQKYHQNLKDRLFPQDSGDSSTDIAICAFLAELSESSLVMLENIG